MKEKGLDTTLPSPIIGLECATEPDDAPSRITLVGENRDVYLSMGAGPWCTGKNHPHSVSETVKMLEKEIDKYGADAIGECGFDFHWEYGSEKEMEELFLAQVSIARSLSVPLIIHSRDADEVLLRHIKEIDEKTIMHCFSSSPGIMNALLDRGAYISFSGNVTYKHSEDIQQSATLCPIDRLLYETDSPYLTPVPMRGKPNRMEYTEYTLSFLASLRNEDASYIKEHAIKNFLLLMNNRKSVVRRDIVALKDVPDNPLPVE